MLFTRERRSSPRLVSWTDFSWTDLEVRRCPKLLTILMSSRQESGSPWEA